VKKEHDEIQKITDSFIKKIDDLLEHKENEIMEV
jgi:ribosome recycling factor